MKKKFLLVGGALAVGALALSSCGSKTRERAKSKELPEATEFLDVSLTYGSNTDKESPTFYCSGEYWLIQPSSDRPCNAGISF